MNKKETTLAINLLDACIDTTASPEVMLALNSLRQTLMALWQRGDCQGMDAQALIRELEPLPVLCRRSALPPTLPDRLCQVMFLMCSPRMGADVGSAAQCREQAANIRRFRQWMQECAAPLLQVDDHVRREVQAFQSGRLEMLEEAFANSLALFRGRIAQAASKRRVERQWEIQRYWEAVPLADVTDAATVSHARLNQAKEKLSDFAAEISATDVLIHVTEDFQTPAEGAREREHPAREAEDET